MGVTVRSALATRADLPRRRAENRMSAVVYGDVLVLAATAGVSRAMGASGEAALIVLGTVASTYLAHVLADIVGAVFTGHDLGSAVAAELRDAVPILSAGAPALALFVLAWLGWPAPIWAQALACGALVVRLAAVGAAYHRLCGPVGRGHALWPSIAVAAAAAASIGVKLALVH